MIDDHDLFERAVERFAPPERSFERLVTRRGRKQRNKRIRAGVVAFVVVAIVAGVFLPSFRSVTVPGDGGETTAVSPPPPGATGSPFPDSSDPVPFEAGTYVMPRSPSSVADFSVTFPEGWEVQNSDTFSMSGTDQGIGFYAILVDSIYADACEGSAGASVTVGGSGVDDLAAALLEQPGPKARGPVETTLGGYPATRIDLTVPPAFDLTPCNLPDALQLWFSPPDDYTVLFPEDEATVYIVDVEGLRQVFFTRSRTTSSAEDRRELQAVLDSIRIET